MQIRCFTRRMTINEYRFMKKILILYCITFIGIMPLVCYNVRDTLFYNIFPRDETRENERIIREDSLNLNFSKQLLNSYRATHNTDFIKHVFKDDMRFEPKTSFKKISLAITIVTVKRKGLEDYEPQYLTQNVAKFLKVLEKVYEDYNPDDLDIHFSVCNVDSQPNNHKELKSLPDWIPVFERFGESQTGRIPNIFDKERQDYVYCINKLLEKNTSFVLLVEDDAIPRDDLFSVLDARIINPVTAGPIFGKLVAEVLYYKLYHPERILGFISLEVERLPELFASGCISACVLVCCYARIYLPRYRPVPLNKLFLICFVYCTLVILVIDRPNLLNLRRVSKYLYQITPAPHCCIIGMLFPRKGGKIVSDYLETVTCHKDFAKDDAIYKLHRNLNAISKMIQPSLFEHIGYISSLHSPNNTLN